MEAMNVTMNKSNRTAHIAQKLLCLKISSFQQLAGADDVLSRWAETPLGIGTPSRGALMPFVHFDQGAPNEPKSTEKTQRGKYQNERPSHFQNSLRVVEGSSYAVFEENQPPGASQQPENAH